MRKLDYYDRNNRYKEILGFKVSREVEKYMEIQLGESSSASDEDGYSYELSKADKNFIYVSYVQYHLNLKQISKLSGISQLDIYRYIKRMKLEPKYDSEKYASRNYADELKLKHFLKLTRR